MFQLREDGISGRLLVTCNEESRSGLRTRWVFVTRPSCMRGTRALGRGTLWPAHMPSYLSWTLGVLCQRAYLPRLVEHVSDPGVHLRRHPGLCGPQRVFADLRLYRAPCGGGLCHLCVDHLHTSVRNKGEASLGEGGRELRGSISVGRQGLKEGRFEEKKEARSREKDPCPSSLWLLAEMWSWDRLLDMPRQLRQWNDAVSPSFPPLYPLALCPPQLLHAPQPHAWALRRPRGARCPHPPSLPLHHRELHPQTHRHPRR